MNDGKKAAFFGVMTVVGFGCSDSGGGEQAAIETPALEVAWVDFPDTRCMDGSATGLVISRNPESTKVLIVLEGGGACFNDDTCADVAHPSGFDENDFNLLRLFIGQGLPGVFDRSVQSNPFRDWNHVFLPYCSGDVFAGSQAASARTGRTHLGYENIGEYLERLVPTFSDAEEVVLSGVSAGGFGAVYNMGQVSDAFSPVPVHVFDDSGPPFSSAFALPCLEAQWREAWNLEATLPGDCTRCGPGQDGFAGVLDYYATTFPDRRMGIITSVQDETTRKFVSFGHVAGDSTCEAIGLMPEAVYTDALTEFRQRSASFSNVASYLIPGVEHVWLLDAPLGAAAPQETTVDGVGLDAWLQAFVDDSADWVNVGAP